MADKPGMVTIRLSAQQARLVHQNVDGWMDAGACKDGLREDEREALSELEDQILKGLRRINKLSPLNGN